MSNSIAIRSNVSGMGVSIKKGTGIAAEVQKSPPPPPATFTPSITDDLLLWIDPDDADTVFQDADRTTPAVDDGDTLLGITDKSGTGRHLSQATEANGATLETTSGVRVFNFANDALAGNHWFDFNQITTGRTIFFVVRWDSTKAANYNFLIGHSVAYNLHGGYLNDMWYSGGVSLTSFFVNSVDTFASIYTYDRPTSLTLLSGNISAGIFDSLARDRDNAYGARSWVGDYGLILIYSSTLSAGQIATIEGEINDFYSIY